MNAVAGDPIPLYGRKQARKRPAVGPHLKPSFLIRIADFDAIAATLPLGNVGYENETNANGERLIWLEPIVVNRLSAVRGPGESYSDVILQIAAEQS